MSALEFKKFEPRPVDITAVLVTDDNRFEVEEFLQAEGHDVRMIWNSDYTEWTIKIHTSHGWRKIKNGTWIVLHPEMGRGWYPMPADNMAQKYQEVVPRPHVEANYLPPYDR